jgi:hypothetical protein
MAIYNPPKGSNIVFNFGNSGYQPLDFFNVNLNASFKGTSTLQAAIEVSQFYTNSTFTYVKQCRKVVVGYTGSGIQVLNLPCLFGGIRDIGAIIQGQLSQVISGSIDLQVRVSTLLRSYTNLSTYIKSLRTGVYDLKSYSRIFTKSIYNLSSYSRIINKYYLDLSSTLIALAASPSVDLKTYIRIFSRASYNLKSYIRIFTESSHNLGTYSRIFTKDYLSLQGNLYVSFCLNLPSYIKVFQRSQNTLRSYIKTISHGSRDLLTYFKLSNRGFINLPSVARTVHKDFISMSSYLLANQPVILGASLNIIEIRDILGYIKGEYRKGFFDLYTEFDRVTLKASRNLPINIHSWDIRELGGIIHSNHTSDLYVELLAGNFGIIKNLATFLNCISPINLQAYIHSYDTKNLETITIVGYQPNDLPSNITSTQPRNLLGYIYGFKAQKIGVNLPSYIRGLEIYNLTTTITPIVASDLFVYINAIGKYKDLPSLIIPKTINIKHTLSISLYEHKDLKAVMSYNCLKSSYTTLFCSLYPINKKDLKTYIIGWFGDKAKNVLDLMAYVNSTLVQVTDFNTFFGDIFIPTAPSVTHKVTSIKNKSTYKTVDYYVISNTYKASILSASIIGVPRSKDLASYITAKPIANFTTLPGWVNPKTFEVIINLNRFEERWYRFVELMFFTNKDNDYFYFFVPEENKVFKVDRNRTWKIQVVGFSDDSSSIYSRTKINKKFIFKLNNYSTIDQALNDFIDRVTLARHSDLSVYLEAYTYPSINLNATIKGVSKKSWVRDCRARIQGVNSSVLTLTSTVQPQLNKNVNNLTALIVGKAYEPPTPTNVVFKFEHTYISPGSYNNMNWSYIQAEDFWKDL